MVNCARKNSCHKKATMREWFRSCGEMCMGHPVCDEHKTPKENSYIVVRTAHPLAIERLGKR